MNERAHPWIKQISMVMPFYPWMKNIHGWGATHILGRTRATIKLALEQRTLGLWEETWPSEKTGRELHAICPKPTKKTLKLHKGLCKAASALIIEMFYVRDEIVS